MLDVPCWALLLALTLYCFWIKVIYWRTKGLRAWGLCPFGCCDALTERPSEVIGNSQKPRFAGSSEASADRHSDHSRSDPSGPCGAIERACAPSSSPKSPCQKPGVKSSLPLPASDRVGCALAVTEKPCDVSCETACANKDRSFAFCSATGRSRDVYFTTEKTQAPSYIPVTFAEPSIEGRCYFCTITKEPGARSLEGVIEPYLLKPGYVVCLENAGSPFPELDCPKTQSFLDPEMLGSDFTRSTASLSREAGVPSLGIQKRIGISSSDKPHIPCPEWPKTTSPFSQKSVQSHNLPCPEDPGDPCRKKPYVTWAERPIVPYEENTKSPGFSSQESSERSNIPCQDTSEGPVIPYQESLDMPSISFEVGLKGHGIPYSKHNERTSIPFRENKERIWLSKENPAKTVFSSAECPQSLGVPHQDHPETPPGLQSDSLDKASHPPCPETPSDIARGPVRVPDLEGGRRSRRHGVREKERDPCTDSSSFPSHATYPTNQDSTDRPEKLCTQISKMSFAPHAERPRHVLCQMSSDAPFYEGPKHVLLLLAHPDDECMFFAPTVISLVKLQYLVSVLCFSSGNYYSQGETRKEELLHSCGILGIPPSRVTVVEHRDLPDSPDAEWEPQLLSSFIMQHVRQKHIRLVLTFDEGGVSGHTNHISLFKAVRYLLLEGKLNAGSVLILESVSIFRKYLSVLDVPISWLQTDDIIFMLTAQEYKQAKRAMMCHQSQLLWFRHAYLLFSRYMWINSLNFLSSQGRSWEPRESLEEEKKTR